MVHTIQALVARIEFLESHIQLLLSSHLQSKKKNISGFKLFTQSMIHHVRSDICEKHFRLYGTRDFKPKYTHVIKQISLMWSLLDFELQSHWNSFALINTNT